MEDRINIVFVTDNNYSEQMIIAIESIVKNIKNNVQITIYIVNLNISKNNLDLIKSKYSDNSNVTIEIVNFAKSKVLEFDIKTHVSSAAYAKIYIPDLIPVEKIIYLDCDLILNANILGLWTQFEEGIPIKAVWNPFYDYDNKYFEVSENYRTFNSGVMLMDLQLMRDQNIPQKLEEFLTENHAKTKLHDQAAFNAIFKYQWSEIEVLWNCQVTMLQNSYKKLQISKRMYFKMFKNAKIIHFTSNSKPWQFRNCHPYKKKYKEIHESIFGEIKYRDLNLMSFLRKVREFFRYRISYLRNLL